MRRLQAPGVDSPPVMAGIPPTLDSDAEDVVWALQTADALWKRAERVDAIVWLRRAAQAAGEAQQDDRALVLARMAAELSDLIATAPAAIPSNIAPPMSEAPAAGVDDLLNDSDIDVVVDSADVISAPATSNPQMQVATAPMAFRPMPVPSFATASPAQLPPLADMMEAVEASVLSASPPEPHRAPAVSAAPSPPPPPEPPSEAPSEAPQSPLVLSSVSSPPAGEVLTAAQAHAGMLDPWANAEPPPLPKIASAPRISTFEDDDEVVTSVKDLQVKPKRPPLPAPLPEKPIVAESTVASGPSPSFEPSLPIVQAFGPPAAHVEEAPPLAPFVPIPSAEPTLVSAGTEATELPIDEAKTDVESAPVAEIAKAQIAPKTPSLRAPEVHTTPSVEAPATTVEIPSVPTVDAPPVFPLKVEVPALAAELETIEAFGDIPDDTRADLASAAIVHALAKDEEVTGFSLAVVLEGEVDVAAMIVDMPAERLNKGRVLKPTGSLRESVPLRLICASASARVATWDDKDIQVAFKACPWVEDDLRTHADRVLALIGVTMGPLADRLDDSIRAQITNRLIVREVPEGKELVAKGAAVRELVIVGQGVIELMDDGVAVGSVGTGEILFGSEVVGGGKAPATARAGKGGALVLAVDRGVAQELIVTLPPLLELLAGM